MNWERRIEKCVEVWKRLKRGREKGIAVDDVFIKPNKAFINILWLTLFRLVHYNNVPRKCARHFDALIILIPCSH